MVNRMENQLHKKNRLLSSHLNGRVNVIVHGENPEPDAAIFMTKVHKPLEPHEYEDIEEIDHTEELDLIDQYNNCAEKIK